MLELFESKLDMEGILVFGTKIKLIENHSLWQPYWQITFADKND